MTCHPHSGSQKHGLEKLLKTPTVSAGGVPRDIIFAVYTSAQQVGQRDHRLFMASFLTCLILNDFFYKLIAENTKIDFSTNFLRR